MKRLISAFLFSSALFLTGCLEVTQNLTINKDGSGVISSTSDLSQVVSLAMQMAGDKMKEQRMDMDTIVQLQSMLDSITSMSAADKELLKKGLVHIVMRMDDNKYFITSTIPFKKTADIEKINTVMQKEVSGRFLDNAMKEAMKQSNLDDSSSLPESRQTPSLSLPENYFILTCRDGLISRTVDKSKLATLDQDEMLNQIKQIGAMGAPLKTNFIIGLPKPAKKVEGKNLKLSDDKKTVTISNELDDLFDDPSLFEFRIEY